MNRKILIAFVSIFTFACASNKNMTTPTEKNDGVHSRDSIPLCLSAKIDSMAAEYPQGSPQSITRYQYRGQIVFYMLAPCCDKFNIVFDSACNILGYPDGGYTGRGDGSMPDFKKEVKGGKTVWKKDDERNEID